ncbi:MAG: MarR family transcriptional regulator [Clostridium sp.]|nr:MarR family transcriptional regulator [Clostridium sp.]
MKEIINKKWALINKINKEFDDLYHKMAVHYNLSDSAFWILYSLYTSKKPCTQKEICDNWCFSKQTINSAIKNLEQIGYISRGYKKIVLTPLGLEVAEKTIHEVIEIENKSLSKINEEELDTIINLFQKTLSSFKEEANKII